MPDNSIKEGSKQPDQIKISFEKGSKDITGHVMPDHAHVGPKYFLVFTLPDFKSKILTQLSEAKKEDGPTLFSLMGQCFRTLVSTSGPMLWASNAPTITIHTS
jgi:hypothetical protein